MRIRKRKVPLPLSSLLPVPLSDLYFNRSPTAIAPFFSGGVTDFDRFIQRDASKKIYKEALDDDNGDCHVDVKSSTADASSSKNVNPLGESDSSIQVDEKNGKVVTLRKRRSLISFEEQEEEASGGGGDHKGKKKKKAKKSGALEEGSRCSRVNGRGWRCCQKTLVGYSLCEHHLGKGRVRSVNKSGGGRGGQGGGRDGQVVAKKAMVMGVKKKKVKLGMVKARSISSLLGQISTSSGNADNVVATESEISAPAYQFADYDK